MGKLALIATVLLPILISVKIAKDRRKSCTWDEARSRDKGVGAFLMIGLALLAEFWHADATSIVGIGQAFLLWYGVYLAARVVYRLRDLKMYSLAAVQKK